MPSIDISIKNGLLINVKVTVRPCVDVNCQDSFLLFLIFAIFYFGQACKPMQPNYSNY